MAGTDQESAAEKQVEYVHLHIELDMSNEHERRFAEMFSALPMGFKTHFCKSLLVDSLPAADADLDLLLAKLIRQQKFRMKPRGRPRSHNKKPARPSAPFVSPRAVAAPPAAPASASGPAPVEEAGAAAGKTTSPSDLAAFGELAGGSGWSSKKPEAVDRE